MGCFWLASSRLSSLNLSVISLIVSPPFSTHLLILAVSSCLHVWLPGRKGVTPLPSAYFCPIFMLSKQWRPYSLLLWQGLVCGYSPSFLKNLKICNELLLHPRHLCWCSASGGAFHVIEIDTWGLLSLQVPSGRWSQFCISCICRDAVPGAISRLSITAAPLGVCGGQEGTSRILRTDVLSKKQGLLWSQTQNTPSVEAGTSWAEPHC